MLPSQKDRLAWLEKRLSKKYPTYCQQAIKRLALTLLKAEDDSHVEEEEVDYNRRLKHEELLDKQAAEEEDSPPTPKVREEDEPPAYKELIAEKVDELANNPLYQKLFNGGQKNKTPPAPDSGVNRRDRMGMTALHWAAYKGDLTEVKRLLEVEHADTTIKDKSKQTPYMIARLEGHEQVRLYLLGK